MTVTDVTIRTELVPGDIGSITHLHGVLYAAQFGWDCTFEAYVAGPLSEFVTSRSDRERIWIVEEGAVHAGSIAIVAGPDDQAQLRWFLLHPRLRGRGLGKRLMAEAVDFCRQQGYASMFLWTVSVCTEAAALYQAFGFEITEEHARDMWGARLLEQRYDLVL